LLSDDTDSNELDGEYDSELKPDVNMRMEHNVDTPDSVNLCGDMDMERDGDDDEEEIEEEENADKEDEEVVEVEKEYEDEEEDEDEDEANEPWTIGQREMVNTSAANVDTTLDYQPIGAT